MRNSEKRPGVGGFTYVGLLLAVAMFGLALAVVGNVWSTTLQRERERELLFAGDAFRKAIADYYENTPGGGAKQFPKTFDDLLLDRRFPVVRRHLRQVYADPFTGKREWGIVKGPGDTIMGIYSLSQRTTLKKGNFPEGYENFEGKNIHSDWQFAYAQNVSGQNAAKPAGKANPQPSGRTNQAISTSSVLRPLVDSGGQSPSSIPLQSVESLAQGATASGAVAAPGQDGAGGYYQRRDLPGAKAAP